MSSVGRVGSFVVVLALGALGALTGCAGEQGAAPPPVAAGLGDAPTTAAIAAMLDDFHDAAAHADEPRYFEHFTDDAVFLGTDGTERWTRDQFRLYAHPRFASGSAWSFKALDRHIDFDPSGRIAWFDESLQTARLGPARGTGVVVKRGGEWKVAQYSLSITIPNERFGGVKEVLDRKMPPPLTLQPQQR